MFLVLKTAWFSQLRSMKFQWEKVTNLYWGRVPFSLSLAHTTAPLWRFALDRRTLLANFNVPSWKNNELWEEISAIPLQTNGLKNRQGRMVGLTTLLSKFKVCLCEFAAPNSLQMLILSIQNTILEVNSPCNARPLACNLSSKRELWWFLAPKLLALERVCDV